MAPSRATTTTTTRTTTISIRTTTAIEKRRFSALLFGAALFALGCGAPPATVPPKLEPSFQLTPLGEALPAAGLQWVALFEPRALWSAPEAREPLTELFPPPRLADFQSRHGVALDAVDELALASFGETDVALARGVFERERVVAAFAQRTGAEGREELATGVVRLGPLRPANGDRLVLFGSRGVLVERGKPGPARAVEAFALGRLKRARPVLGAEPLASAARDLGPRPIRFFMPGPFGERWAAAGGGLFRTATALSVGVRFLPAEAPANEPRLELVVQLGGAFPEDGSAETRFAATVDRVLLSDLGRLLGTDAPLEPLRIDRTTAGLRARVVVRSKNALRGLRDAVVASPEAIFR